MEEAIYQVLDFWLLKGVDGFRFDVINNLSVSGSLADNPVTGNGEQLHENDINQLRTLTDKPIIKAFCIKESEDITDAESCLADYILLDSGEGTGTVFDWKKIQNIQRPYFLAGGLSIDNVENAVRQLNPYAVDVSSGIETDGLKDKTKMAAFVAAVRKEERL